MKMTKKLLCLVFLLVIAAVPLLTAYGVVTDPTGWSSQENRALAGSTLIIRVPDVTDTGVGDRLCAREGLFPCFGDIVGIHSAGVPDTEQPLRSVSASATASAQIRFFMRPTLPGA